ncbi:MAG TPA: hypothetical protein DCW44_05160 [Eubacterium sp.]|nr:hypothetical protein [Eubacterium sp.]
MNDNMDYGSSISVVIPNYNNSMYIEKCIRSVLNQTYNNIREIIVVDDKSTDNSRDIINDISKEDERVIPIFLDKNRKVSAARNKGLEKVSSKFVTFLDGDDYYYNPEKIENEMKLLLDKDSNNSISYSYIVRVSASDNIVSKQKISDKKLLTGYIYNDLLKATNLAYIMRDYCVQTDLIRQIGGYNENKSFFEDYEVIVKLARKSKFYCTKEYGTAYRVSENGLSKRPYDEQLRAINSIACNEIRHQHIYKKMYLMPIRYSLVYSRIIFYKIRNLIKK